jgi:MFS-type transporter involved in bile tolerance (Atg22 family)
MRRKQASHCPNARSPYNFRVATVESITALLQSQARHKHLVNSEEAIDMKLIKSTVSNLSRVFASASLGGVIDFVRRKVLATYYTALTVFFTAILTCESNMRRPCYPTCCTSRFFGYT